MDTNIEKTDKECFVSQSIAMDDATESQKTVKKYTLPLPQGYKEYQIVKNGKFPLQSLIV